MTATLDQLFNAIASRDDERALELLTRLPSLATETARAGATRTESTVHFLTPIAHYVYSGDTALHIAAAAYDASLIDRLLALGADIHARNRLGATALHLASDGQPDGTRWNPTAQVATITRLLDAGIDPDVVDKRGVTPLHRAIRARCSAAARVLLERGAAAHRPNGNGSTPLQLATKNTGRGGSGSAAAKREQSEIIQLLTARTSRR